MVHDITRPPELNITIKAVAVSEVRNVISNLGGRKAARSDLIIDEIIGSSQGL